MSGTPHIAILPSPGMGHLIPMAEFAKRLVHHHNFSITFVIPTDGPPSSAYQQVLTSLPSSIDHIFLPQVDLTDVVSQSPAHPRIETLISLTVARSLSSLRTTLSSLQSSKNLVSLVVDLFGTDAFDPAIELGISPYIFFPSTAMTLSLFLYMPQLDKSVTCEFRHMTDLVRIPGCVPVRGSDLFDPVQDRTDEAYKWVIHHSNRYPMAEGVIENSFMELEHGALKYLQTVQSGKPPVYAVGPLIKMDYDVDDSGSKIIEWLDDQPVGSVLFVSFGSGGTLSYEQMTELAHGLESSQQRFLWVVRSPNQIPNSTYFSVQSQKDPLAYLPEGFLNRTEGRGLVVSNWAPQAQILSHGSTGGFMSHCGWNSILESVVHGVPIIAWPLYAEQKMNSIIVVEDVKVALRPAGVGERVVERSEITAVVKALMEGEEGKKVRNRMKELKEAAARAVSDDGASTIAIADLAQKWRSSMKH
uniref:Glycosyltransferase n=1 Tax=Rhodiola rosea TaxID=203015 RepID=A0A2I6B3N5_RHORB|nr:uridine 5'-diphospho-glucosyltransferase 3 [Rhodiola rosea]